MTTSDSPRLPPAIGLGSAARDLYRALWRHADRRARPIARRCRAAVRGAAAAADHALAGGPGHQRAAAGRHGDGRPLDRRPHRDLPAVMAAARPGPHPGAQRGRAGARAAGRPLYARIAAAPLAWHDGHHSGELQHRVHQASRALSDFAQNQFIYLRTSSTSSARWSR